MTSIYGIPPVHICADRIALARISTERVSLMSAGMGPKYGVCIDVVSVCSATAWVVDGEAKGVKVLCYGYDWGERIVVDVFREGEAGLDQLPSEEDRVGGFKVEAARDGVEDRGRKIGPRVGRVFYTVDDHDRRGCWTCERSEIELYIYHIYVSDG